MMQKSTLLFLEDDDVIKVCHLVGRSYHRILIGKVIHSVLNTASPFDFQLEW